MMKEDKEPEKTTKNDGLERELKNRKMNIKVMIILIVLFLIGILIRWDYISSEINIDRYINPNKSIADTINSK